MDAVLGLKSAERLGMAGADATDPTGVALAMLSPYVQGAVVESFLEYFSHVRVHAWATACECYGTECRASGRLEVNTLQVAEPVEVCQLSWQGHVSKVQRAVAAAVRADAVHGGEEELDTLRNKTVEDIWTKLFSLSGVCEWDDLQATVGLFPSLWEAFQALRDSLVDGPVAAATTTTALPSWAPAPTGVPPPPVVVGTDPYDYDNSSELAAPEDPEKVFTETLRQWVKAYPDANLYRLGVVYNGGYSLHDIPIKADVRSYSREDLCYLLERTDPQGEACGSCSGTSQRGDRLDWYMFDREQIENAISGRDPSRRFRPFANEPFINDRQRCWHAGCLLRRLCKWFSSMEFEEHAEPCESTTKYEKNQCAKENVVQGQVCASATLWSASQRITTAGKKYEAAIQAASLEAQAAVMDVVQQELELETERQELFRELTTDWLSTVVDGFVGAVTVGLGDGAGVVANYVGGVATAGTSHVLAGPIIELQRQREDLLKERKEIVEKIHANANWTANLSFQEDMQEASDKLTEGLCAYWAQEVCDLTLTASNHLEALTLQNDAVMMRQNDQRALDERMALANQTATLRHNTMQALQDLDSKVSQLLTAVDGDDQHTQELLELQSTANDLQTIKDAVGDITTISNDAKTAVIEIKAVRTVVDRSEVLLKNLASNLSNLNNLTTELSSSIKVSAGRVVKKLSDKVDNATKHIMGLVQEGIDNVSARVDNFQSEFHVSMDMLQADHSMMMDLLVANTMRLDELHASVEANAELAEEHQVEDHIIRVYAQLSAIEGVFADALEVLQRGMTGRDRLLRAVRKYEQCHEPWSTVQAVRAEYRAGVAKSVVHSEASREKLADLYKRQRTALVDLATIMTNGRVLKRLVEEALLGVSEGEITKLPAFQRGGCRQLLAPWGIEQLGEVIRKVSHATMTRHAAQLWRGHQMVVWTRSALLQAGVTVGAKTDAMVRSAWRRIVEEVHGIIKTFELPSTDASKELLLLYSKLLERLLPEICPVPPACVAAVLKVAPGAVTTELVQWDSYDLANGERLLSILARPQALLSAGAQSGWEVDVRQPIPADIMHFDGNLPERVFTCTLEAGGTSYTALRVADAPAGVASALPDGASCFCAASVGSDTEGQVVIGRECHHVGEICKGAPTVPIDTWSPAHRPWLLPGLESWTSELRSLQGGQCGDGMRQPWEACDEGSVLASGGCDRCLRIRPGFVCTAAGAACATVCGDGILAGREQCDDGGLADGDGCSSTCHVEAQCSKAAGIEVFRRLPSTGRPWLSSDQLGRDLDVVWPLSALPGEATAAPVPDLSWATAACSSMVCPQDCTPRAERMSLSCHGPVCSEEVDGPHCCHCGAPCSSLSCPQGYNPLPQGESVRFCAGSVCNETTDLETCCLPSSPKQFPCALSSSGEARTCVVTSERKARCSDTFEGPWASSLANVSGIAVYDEYACAIVNSAGLGAPGSVSCSGRLQDGVVGDPPHLTDVVQVAPGARHGCALRSTGAVVCWGGVHGDSEVPADLPPARMIAAGTGMTCALDFLGRHRCWGTGRDNIGIGQLPDIEYRAIDCGFRHYCAVGKHDGKAYCAGNHEDSWTDGMIAVPSGLPFLTAVDVKGYCNIFLDEAGMPHTWGYVCNLPTWQPALKASDPLTQVASGNGNACCGVGDSGRLYCSGVSLDVDVPLMTVCPEVQEAALAQTASGVAAGRRTSEEAEEAEEADPELEPCFSWIVGASGQVPTVAAVQASCRGSTTYVFVVLRGNTTEVRHDLLLDSTGAFESALAAARTSVLPGLTLRTRPLAGGATAFGFYCAGSSDRDCQLWEVPLGAVFGQDDGGNSSLGGNGSGGNTSGDATEGNATLAKVLAAFGSSQAGGVAHSAGNEPGLTYAIYKVAGGGTGPLACGAVFAPACGDGHVSGAEECDDTASGGCDEACRVIPGWACHSQGGPNSCSSCEPEGTLDATGHCQPSSP